MTSPIPWPPAGAVSVETHISTVWLTDDCAYKAKKPVQLVFLDARSLAVREAFCHEELRLNGRTAPSLYRDVLPVTRDAAGTWLDGPGEVVDWVVRMRRFPDDALLAHAAAQGTLTDWQVDRAAAAIARFHGALPPLPAAALCAKSLRDWAAENVAEIVELVATQSVVTLHEVQHLGTTLDAQFAAMTDWQAMRVDAGWLREGHGDLHLGNLVQWEGDVQAFDAIDFDPSLRIIDVVADAAFCWMDLLAYGHERLAWRFLSAYVEAMGDVDGLRGLAPYAAYRALVRAKVALLRDDAADFARYWTVAARLVAAPPPAVLVLMTGRSGSGKSTVAQVLAEALGAVRVRSDVERKRLFGLAPTERPADRAAVYSADATARTYARLEALTAAALDAGHRVVVDAAALRQAEREGFAVLAAARGAAFAVVECVGSPSVLSARLTARGAQGTDPSDADVAVMQRQAAQLEPVPDAWAAVHHVLHNDGDVAAAQAAAARVAQHLLAAP